MNQRKEISIFKPIVVTKQFTETERDLFFEQLQHDSGVDAYHFDAIKELEKDKLTDTKQLSDIPEMLIKELVGHISVITAKKTSKEYSLPLQFNRPIKSFSKDLSNKSVIARDTKTNVIGVNFSSDPLKNNIDTQMPLWISRESEQVIINTGRYETRLTNHLGNKLFFQDLLFSTLNKKLKLFPVDAVVYFSDSLDAKEKLKTLAQYINYRTELIQQIFPFVQNYIMSSQYKQESLSKTDVKQTHPPKFPILDQLLTEVNKQYSGRLYQPKHYPKMNMSIIYDLTNSQLWNIYQRLYMGVSAGELISKHKNEQMMILKEKKTHENNIKTSMEHTKKNAIAKATFGATNFSQLSKSEKEVIDVKYNQWVAKEKTATHAKCQHMNLLRQVMGSYGPRTKFNSFAWAKLKQLIPKDREDGMLTCKKCVKCDMLVLCPHHYDLFDFRPSRTGETGPAADHAAMKEKRDMLMRKYVDKNAIQNAHYCKVCGEKIIQNYDEKKQVFVDGERVVDVKTTDFLQGKIWKEVRNILTASFDFVISTDINYMVTSITESIKEYIEEVKRRSEAIKTNTPTDVLNSLYLHISLYTFAAMVKIISHHPDDILIKGLKRRTDKKIKVNPATGRVNIKYLQLLFNSALTEINRTKGDIIKNIKYISFDAVKILFVKAYKQINASYIKTATINTELPSQYVVYSVVYQYLYYAKKKDNPNLKITDVREILNVELQDIPSLTHIAEKAELPTQWTAISNGLVNNNTHSSKYAIYAYKSFIHFMSYVQDMTYMLPIISEAHLQHQKEYIELRDVEIKFRNEKREQVAVPVIDYNHRKLAKQFSFVDVNLRSTYCKDGQRHKFDIFVYSNKKPPELPQPSSIPRSQGRVGGSSIEKVEIYKKDIGKWMFDPDKNKKLRNMIIIDRKCSVCREYESKEESSLSDVINVRNIIDDVKSFYSFYHSKCPVKKVHVWKNDKCSQCGLTKKTLSETKVLHGDSYWEKYKEKYYADIKRFGKVVMKEAQEKYPPAKPIYKYKTQEGSLTKKVEHFPWKKQQYAIVNMSRFTKIPVNALVNIGLFEGQNYDDIYFNKSNPSVELTSKYRKQRTNYLESYISSIIIEYQLLRSGGKTTSSTKIEKIREDMPEVDFSSLPDITSEYNAKHSYYKYIAKISAELLNNFILHSMCDMLLEAYGQVSNESLKKGLSDFINYIMQKILKEEKHLCDPGPLTAKQINEDKQNYGGDAVDSEFYEDPEIDVDSPDYDPFNVDSIDISREDIENNMQTGDS